MMLNWLALRLADHLVDRLVERLADRLAGPLAERLTDVHHGRPASRWDPQSSAPPRPEVSGAHLGATERER